MEVDEASRPGLPGAQMVKAPHRRPPFGDKPRDPVDVLVGKADVEQIARRSPGEVVRGLHDHERHQDGHHRVQPAQVEARRDHPSHPDHQQPGRDAHRGVHVGTQVPGVGLKRHRVCLLAHLEQPFRDERVHEGRDQHDPYPPERHVYRLGPDQPVHGFVDDPDGRDEYEQCLYGPGDVLVLPVAVRVALVRLLAGCAHREEGDHGGKQVDSRVDGLRKDRHRTDEQADGDLEHDEQAVGEHRQRGDAGLLVGKLYHRPPNTQKSPTGTDASRRAHVPAARSPATPRSAPENRMRAGVA